MGKGGYAWRCDEEPLIHLQMPNDKAKSRKWSAAEFTLM
jgi:hypothetical protein